MRIDGKVLAQDIFKEIKEKSSALPQGVIPHLAIITVGEESSWETYVTQKQKRAQELGFKASVHTLHGASSESVTALVNQLNDDPSVHGIIIQRPLPHKMDSDSITLAINPSKDVDGFRRDSKFQPPIWLAVEYILEYIYRNGQPQETYPQWLAQQTITVVGKGETAGKPIIQGLYRQNILPKVIDSQSDHPEKILQQSDIIVSGVGKTLISASSLKKGAILIGIGIRREEGKLRGDYNESEIETTASWYTPTPGGVGRVNLAFLMYNVLRATLNQSKK